MEEKKKYSDCIQRGNRRIVKVTSDSCAFEMDSSTSCLCGMRACTIHMIEEDMVARCLF